MAKEIVSPGELLGSEEEFFGNEKTYPENGNVYSLVLGEKKMLNRQLQVSAKKFTRMLRKGDLVIGLVKDLYDSVSLIVIESADQIRGTGAAHANTNPQDPSQNNFERKAIGSTYAYMRITELVHGGGYVRNFRQYIKMGDILRARVIEVNTLGTYLTIAEDNLGVLKAHCSQCRTELQQRGRVLVCDNCGNKESRKLAIA